MYCGEILAWKRELAGKHYRDKMYAYHVDSRDKPSPSHFQSYSPHFSSHMHASTSTHLFQQCY